MLEDNIEAWTAAVEADTLKPRAEAQIGDVWVAQQEINTMIRSVQAWMQPEHVATPAALVPASSRIEKQPFGVTLVIAPSNYPLQLALCPLFGAIAAGNACVLKPSEQCPEVAQCLEAFVKAYLDPEAVRVLQGGAGMVQALLAERWDHIIFTGSERVGRIVAAAAAAHLTPTTLELGGKCPVFVADDVTEPIESIAYKLLWGRLLSGGQSCVAPEYVLLPKGLVRPLADKLVAHLAEAHGEDPKSSPHFGRVCSSHAASRIGGLLVGHGGRVVCGGVADPERRYVSPTIILDPSPASRVMTEECFGPVLCLLGVDTLDEAMEYVQTKPTPLALYVFTSSQATARRVLDRVPSGNALVNDVVVQFASPALPFGGLGPSGMGALHGKFYFDACCQKRGVVTKGSGALTRALDLQVFLRAPPYTRFNLALGRLLMTKLPILLPAHYGYKSLVLIFASLALYTLYVCGVLVPSLRYLCQAILEYTA